MNQNSPVGGSRRRGPNYRFLKVVLLLVASLACLETGVRACAPLPAYKPAPYADILCDYRLSATRDGLFQAPFNLVKVPKPANRVRIVVLGSSAVIGNVVTPFQSFPGRLQELVLRCAQNIEVINCGLPGADTSQQLAALPEFLKLEPDIVLYYVGNNETTRLLSYRYQNPTWTPQSEVLRRLTFHSALYQWLSNRNSWGPSTKAPDFVDPGKLPTQTTAQENALIDEQLCQNVTDIIHLCQARSAKVMLCPNIANVDAIQVEVHPFDHLLAQIAQNNQASYFDLRSILQAQYGVRLGDNVLADSTHFLPQTNTYIAQQLYGRLKTLGWLAPAGTVGYLPDDSRWNLQNCSYLVREAQELFPEGSKAAALEKTLMPATTALGKTERGHLYFCSQHYSEAANSYSAALHLLDISPQAPKSRKISAALHRNLGHAQLFNDKADLAMQSYCQFLKLGGSNPLFTQDYLKP